MTKWFVLSLVLALPGLCLAQSESATLSGRVSDSSGAAIRGADVVLTNTQTNVEQRTKANEVGLYVFAGVHPGTYRVAAGAPGFRVLIKEGLTLHVQDELAENFSLTVGAISESMTVTADASLINTTDATVSTVVDRQFAENLPMNGRSFQTLIMLTPGVVLTSASEFGDQGQFSVNGQRADANYFSVDGVSANVGVGGYLLLGQNGGGALPALSVQGGTNSLVSVDAMQEFRIQTSSFAPEFGRSPGGQISILTRSGTNGFHGTLFDYFRNDALDANDWFSNRDHLHKPAERQNDFGGVVGGPIITDRMFFFLSYEGLRLRQPITAETVVPDTTSRQQAPVAMQPYLNVFPVPNGPELGNELAQFNASYSNPSSLDAYSLRIDHTINSKLALFGRYNYSPSQTSQRSYLLTVLNNVGTTQNALHTFTLGLTESVSQKISNEVRANYSNSSVSTSYTIDTFGGGVPLPNSLMFPTGYSPSNAIFQIYIPGIGGTGAGKPGASEQRQVNLADNLSVTAGTHQVKVGVDYRWLSPFSTPGAYALGLDFYGLTGPGGAVSGTVPFVAVSAFQGDSLLSRNFSFYGQDTWKMKRGLTLTYGLRWDVNPPIKGKNRSNDPFTVKGLNNPATMTLAPRGTPLYNTTYGNVAPRIGIAYQLTQSQKWATVFRAGAGVFYDIGSGTLGDVASYFPYNANKSLFNVPVPLTPQQLVPPALSLNPPVSDLVVTEPNLRLPRTYQWNVALEQAFDASQTLSLTYIGALGRDQLREEALYFPNRDFGFVLVARNTAPSDYHALQLKFQRRLSRGLQALASYTFSHSIDIASTDALDYSNTPGGVANPNMDRGNSDFDVRHSFTGALTYDLPAFRLQRARAILGGWSVDTFVMARSAVPVNLIGATSFVANTYFQSRPDVVPGMPFYLYGAQYPGGKVFNPAAFNAATAGKQGNLGRNVLRGFSAWQADFALVRQFHPTDRIGLQFRAEMFNLFNHPNFGSPDNTLSNHLFGQSTQTLASSLGGGGGSGGFNPLYQIGGPRSIQLALKLMF
jgi:hypothetical protein